MKNIKSLLFCILNLIFCLSILIFGIQRASAKEINIYSYRSPTLLEPFTKEYEKEFSVKFNVLHAKKGLAQRLKSEGKNSPADVILTVDISRLSELADMNLVKNINSDIRLFGCRCLDLAYLSSGKIDCYVSDEEFEKSPDPGLLFIKESGGMIYKKQSLEKIFFYSNNYINDILESKL